MLRGIASVRKAWATPRLHLRATGRAAQIPYAQSGAATRLFSLYSEPKRKARVILEDGSVFEGISFGAEKNVAGEMVFSTGMVGYTESLTDPSYRGQILTLTFPMVGNYGVPCNIRRDQHGLPKGFESDKIHTSALLVQDYSYYYSHWDANKSLSEWLKEEGVPALHGIDTRMMTKKIRSKGAMLGRIEFDGEPSIGFDDPNLRNLVAEVSTKEVRMFGEGNPLKILAVDCGIKYNIIRQLVKKGAEVKLVPWDHDLSKELDWADGVFLSNGPGDPAMCVETIAQLRKIISAEGDKLKPVFGICLGNQLMALAAGAQREKLKFGNRGQNQPVINTLTKQCYITPQNHGYAVNSQTLPPDWKELFVNANDHTNEGIMHTSKPFFTAQFHPEAMGGPTDTEFLFDVFLENVRSKNRALVFPEKPGPPPRPQIKKVLLLGSGGLSIGQAGEFDYSGSQAIKALKEEGVSVVLMNPNIASVQTNVGTDSTEFRADQVFFLPVTVEFIEQVIKRERPDGIVLSMGGQTALNAGVELYRKGLLDKYNVKVLGTPVPAIMATEDREEFAGKLKEINEKLAPSEACENLQEVLAAAKRIGYPVMIRSAYALGGLGSGICKDEEELIHMTGMAFSHSPQVLVEKSLKGWKEVEYEVVRDAADNCITVCNMENFDPLGVHTGDSVVIAPSQTLSNEEYHMLRETAIKVVRHLGIVGECNIQYALDPFSLEYCIIEVNARLSRSSALASKATGYPLAFVAAKLALGITLPEIENAVTKSTQACFEPSLDYVVTKIPRWDMAKFQGVSTRIGSAMKSVGEVMAIGRTWEESMQKALRMVEPSIVGFEPRGIEMTSAQISEELENPTDRRVFAIAQVMEGKSLSVKEIHDLSKIDPWFLRRLERIADFRTYMHGLQLGEMGRNVMLEAKQLGFSDKQIARALKGDANEDQVRSHRLSVGVTPFVKQIDTMAAEYPAQTNYLYMTYHANENDVEASDVGDHGAVIVLGSGAYRIGSSVEFDWCGVSTIRTLRKLGYKSIMVNYNPETVSTDYDECDQLYFEELSKERVLDIYGLEKALGVVVSVGGQIPNTLALPLYKAGVALLGTSPEMIDKAEDRFKFSAMIDSLGLQQPSWKELTTVDDALSFADQVSYPVLVRPSYVLSGAAMNVAYSADELRGFLKDAADVSPEHPVVVSKYIHNAREIEMDGIARNGEVIGAAVHEHIENAGVHSGDATLLLPTQTVNEYQLRRVEAATKKIAKELNITGPFNIQFIVKGTDVMVIECNLRASRSFPFVSKTMNVDFIEAAAKLMMARDVSDMPLPPLGTRNRPNGYVGCKAPMFSFTRLKGADPVLGVEMASTGEVACFGVDKHEAFLKAMLSAGFKIPKKNIVISMHESLGEELVPYVFSLTEMGYNVLATQKTHQFLQSKGVPTKLVHFPLDKHQEPNLHGLIKRREVDLVINLPTSESEQVENNYIIRRSSVDYGVPLLSNPQLVMMFVEALTKHRKGEIIGLDADSLFDYYAREKPEDAWTSPTEFH